MHSFSLRYRSWWIMRAFGRNPLLRWTDRLEACVIVFAIVAALAATPVCAAAGAGVYRSHARSTPRSPAHATPSPRRWSNLARPCTPRTPPAVPS